MRQYAETVFDVVISFIAADEPIALQLRDLLQPPLNVFVYSKRQEELAGKDGVEAFRSVFRERARLAVILFRSPWGETPWTRVEKVAIEELCLEEGWEHLIFVRLDRETAVPKWVPKPHLYVDLQTFTLADLVGAIKARLLEMDVEIRRPTPADRAGAQARQQAFDDETRALLDRTNGEYLMAVSLLEQALTATAKTVADAAGWRVDAGNGAIVGGFVITAQGQTIGLTSRELYANTARDAYIELAEYDQTIPVRQPELRYYAPEGIRNAGTRRIEIRRLPDLGWCWEIGGRVYPILAAADVIVGILLDRIEAARGRR